MRNVPADDWIHDVALVTPRPCVRADETAAIHQRHLPDGVNLTDSWMVRSRDQLLGLSLVAARVYGGEHDGAIATWAVLFSASDPVNTPTYSIPVDAVARSLEFGDHLSLPEDHGLVSWADLDGVASARACVEAAAP